MGNAAMTIGRERMKNSRASLRLVIERFPEHQPSLERLWEVNSSFQSLCDEYENCVAALKYWQLSAEQEARHYRDEYAALVPELEAEILYYLGESDEGPAASDH
jgi:hypothetical protein